jgi:hypothetical protein
MMPVQNYQKSNTYSQTVIELNSSFEGAEKFFIFINRKNLDFFQPKMNFKSFSKINLSFIQDFEKLSKL